MVGQLSQRLQPQRQHHRRRQSRGRAQQRARTQQLQSRQIAQTAPDDPQQQWRCTGDGVVPAGAGDPQHRQRQQAVAPARMAQLQAQHPHRQCKRPEHRHVLPDVRGHQQQRRPQAEHGNDRRAHAVVRVEAGSNAAKCGPDHGLLQQQLRSRAAPPGFDPRPQQGLQRWVQRIERAGSRLLPLVGRVPAQPARREGPEREHAARQRNRPRHQCLAGGGTHGRCSRPR